MAILNNSSISKEQRVVLFGKLLARDLDIPLIGRFVMGRYWRRENRQQRQTYMKVFRSYVIPAYSLRSGGAEVDKFDVINTKFIVKKDFLVISEVVKARKLANTSAQRYLSDS